MEHVGATGKQQQKRQKLWVWGRQVGGWVAKEELPSDWEPR